MTLRSPKAARDTRAARCAIEHHNLWNTSKGRIEVFYGLKDRMRRWRFARECDGVLDTPPVPLDTASEIVLLSQLQHKDC